MPKHELEKLYGLTATELLDAINRRFRAKVTLEGAVAEVKLGKILQQLKVQGTITLLEEHDSDGLHDFTIAHHGKSIRVECKNVRNSDEAYREKGVVVAYKVETQKTRTSEGDKSSRYYNHDQFDIIAVCLGKKTGDWNSFMFCKTLNLSRHKDYENKLAVMHRVPLPEDRLTWGFWRNDITELFD